MGIETITILIVVSMIVLMLLGVPLAWVTMTLAVGCTLFWLGPSGLPLVASRVYGFVSEYVFVAVPLFVLMACVLERSGVAQDLYRAMHIFAGGLPGGLAVQTTLVAVVMAAMTGIIGGEIVLLGLIALPQMLKLNYDPKLAIGTICAGGSLGTMIPPSVVLILYGLTANVSISDLFLAGITPGLLLCGLYIGYIIFRCWLNPALGPPAPIEDREMPWAEKVVLLKGLALPVMIIVWVLGSIYSGIASVTESAAVGACGAIASAAIRSELNWPMLKGALIQTMTTVGILLWLAFGANALIGIYNIMGGTSYLRGLITGLPLEPLGIVMVMMVILVILGMFMDWIGILLLTMPIFVPVAKDLGFDPVWFGILFCMNMQASYLTPPFGPAAFYLKSVAPPEIDIQTIFKGVLPFVGLQLIGLFLILFFPDIALWPIR
ncbi:MAG: TRAP transporter large permease subunit [Alphaproteobacteria bacterium]|nr:TRAP transporter large permease subunit [Alphaproteobacteria bacterium]